MPPVLSSLLNQLAPGHCLMCRMRCPGKTQLCQLCGAEIPRLINPCRCCALPLADAGQVCGHCQRQPPPYSTVCAAAPYTAPLSNLLHRFKYAGDATLAATFAELLEPQLQHWLDTHPTPDWLVAMPLHWLRQLQRGFNQAELLARAMAGHHGLRHFQLRVNGRLCRRTRRTREQSTLDSQQRLHNMAGAFACKPLVGDPHIAIIDDILTTGSSADALTRTLFQAGAGRVDIWVIARTPAPQ